MIPINYLSNYWRRRKGRGRERSSASSIYLTFGLGQIILPPSTSILTLFTSIFFCQMAWQSFLSHKDAVKIKWVNVKHWEQSLHTVSSQCIYFGLNWVPPTHTHTNLYIEVLTLGNSLCRYNKPKMKSLRWAFLVAQTVKNLPATQETRIQSLDWKDLLEKEMATHSSILA